MSSVLLAVLFLAWFYSPDHPKSTRDPGITILGSQLTGLARLSYNRKVDFVAFNYGAEIFAKRASPAHVIRPLVLRPDFTPSPLTLTIFQSPPNTHKIIALPVNFFIDAQIYAPTAFCLLSIVREQSTFSWSFLSKKKPMD